jgi:hypothetical protein
VQLGLRILLSERKEHKSSKGARNKTPCHGGALGQKATRKEILGVVLGLTVSVYRVLGGDPSSSAGSVKQHHIARTHLKKRNQRQPSQPRKHTRTHTHTHTHTHSPHGTAGVKRHKSSVQLEQHQTRWRGDDSSKCRSSYKGAVCRNVGAMWAQCGRNVVAVWMGC